MQEYHLCEASTMPHLIVKRGFTLPSKPSVRLPLKPSQIPTRPLVSLPAARRPNHRHTLSVTAEQLVYAIVAIMLGGTAYYYLAGMAVYRIVALVVIGILWSSFAGRAALRRPVDMQETISLPAFPAGDYTDETYTYLKAIKKSLVGR